MTSEVTPVTPTADSVNGEEMDFFETSSNRCELHAPRSDSPHTPHQVDKMRRTLHFHFMTPCEKFKARRRKPWKLLLQLIKLVLVTLQVSALGSARQTFVDFHNQSVLALKHIMLYKWDPSYETLPYPAATGRYALYTVSEMYENLNNAMIGYNKIGSEAIGAYGYASSPGVNNSRTAQLCLTSFTLGRIFPNNLTYALNPKLQTECLDFVPVKLANGSEVFDSKKLLKEQKKDIAINRLHKIELKFELSAIHIKEYVTIEPFDAPDCLHIQGTILYDNTQHNGQMPVRLLLDMNALQCEEASTYDRNQDSELGFTVGYDCFVIICCFFSFILCARSLRKSIKLMATAKCFFMEHYKHKMTREEKLHFINFWFITICVSDILTIIGSGLKIAVIYKQLYLYDSSSMLLGSSNLLAWIGVLRYFGFFSKYNILLLTMKKALPEVLRFLVCASVFYFGYTFCGWLVLGPYHVKFRTVATTSECLFSLINGDDMFVTFSVINDQQSQSIWVFSRVYLYSFISLFIYFILNVFVSVIIGTYEMIRTYNKYGFPRTFMEKFMDSRIDDPNSPLFRSDIEVRRQHFCLLSCCRPCNGDGEYDDSQTILG